MWELDARPLEQQARALVAFVWSLGEVLSQSHGSSVRQGWHRYAPSGRLFDVVDPEVTALRDGRDQMECIL